VKNHENDEKLQKNYASMADKMIRKKYKIEKKFKNMLK